MAVQPSGSSSSDAARAAPRPSTHACTRPARCTRGSGDRFGIPNPRESGSVIGADRRRSGPSCVLRKRVPQGQTESGGIVLAAMCWSPCAQRRCYPTGRCAYRHLGTFLLSINLLDCQSTFLIVKKTPISHTLFFCQCVKP